MLLNYIKLKGFMRYKNQVTVDIKDGITVIYGNNGAGKTSLIDGIFLCLYGKTVRTSGKSASGFLSIKDLINRESNEAEVVVGFSINNIEYEVTRKISKTGKTIAYIKSEGKQLAEGENVAILLENSIIGLGYDSLKNSIMIMQDEMSKYIDMGQTERKNALLDLFKINEFDTYNSTANIIKKENEYKISDVEAKISYIESIASEKERVEKELNVENKKLEKINNENVAKKDDLDKLQKEKDELIEEKNAINTEIKLLMQENETSEREMKVLNKNLSEISDKTVCPLCLQPIEKNETITDHYKKEISEHMKKIKDSMEKINGKKEELEIINNNGNEIDSEILKAKKELFETSDAERKDIEQTIIRLSAKLEDIEEKYIEIEDLKTRLKELKEREELIEILKSAYSEIPKLILARLVPSIEVEASNILSVISQNYISEIKIEQESFRLKPMVNGRFEEIQFLSSGEKVRVAIALRVAISNIISKLSALPTMKNFNGIKTLIIDEGDFGSLDNDGVNSIMAILQNLKKLFPKIIIITHLDVIKENLPDNVINIEKTEDKYESRINTQD